MVNAKDMQNATSFDDFNKNLKFLTCHFLILFKAYIRGSQTLTPFYRGSLPLSFIFILIFQWQMVFSIYCKKP
jgi:hypothetical protein